MNYLQILSKPLQGGGRAILMLTLLGAILVLGSHRLSADDQHHINLFVGDRATGLAGAYTAISDGPEGAYYNPAGMAFSPASYVSISTNAFQYKNFSYKDIWHDVDPTQIINYDRPSLTLIPNFFGTIQKTDNVTFAFTLTSLENESFDQRDKLTLPFTPSGGPATTQILNVGFIQNTTNEELGASWGVLVTPEVSLGWGAFVGYRDSKTISEQVQQFTGFAYFSTVNQYDRRQRISFRPSFGVQIVPTKLISIGFSTTMNLPVWELQTTASSTTSASATGSTTGSVLNTDMINLVGDATPTTYNLFSDGLFETTSIDSSIGIALFLSHSFLVSANFSLYIPLQGTKPIATTQIVTWNVAAGFEWYITPNFPLRFGLYTNNANTPVIDINQINQPDHLDLYGASLSIGYATSNFDLNLGVSGSLGWLGQAQLIANVAQTQRLTGGTFQVLLSGSFH